MGSNIVATAFVLPNHKHSSAPADGGSLAGGTTLINGVAINAAAAKLLNNLQGYPIWEGDISWILGLTVTQSVTLDTAFVIPTGAWVLNPAVSGLLQVYMGGAWTTIATIGSGTSMFVQSDGTNVRFYNNSATGDLNYAPVINS